MEWEIKPFVETGRFLARPVYQFVSGFMVPIDFRYACASEWHPVFRIGFAILWLGYSAMFWMFWEWIRMGINRRRYLSNHTVAVGIPNGADLKRK